MQNSFWKSIFEFLTFRRMASPVLLQILFWAGIAGTLFGVYVLLKLDNGAWPLPLIFGPLLLRVIAERAIVSFRMHDNIRGIHDMMQNEHKSASR